MDGGTEFRQLSAPEHLCYDYASKLTYIQLKRYTDRFNELHLTDDEQRALETGIALNPVLPPVIEGTGGIREFQFSMPSDNLGSLHLTAFYCYFPENGKVVLMSLMETEEVGEMNPESREQLKRIFEALQEFGPEAWEEPM